MSDVYERLRDRLDDLSAGYPQSDNHVELKILRRLFTEEEADFFIKLTPILETPAAAAQRLGLDERETAELMERMAAKGLLFRKQKDGGRASYAMVPFVVGIYEFQLTNLDRELARDIEDYFEQVIGKQFQSFKTPIMRTIPINREIVAEWPVAPYEDAIRIIDEQEVIAIAPCVCRTQQGLLDHPCDKPLERCFMFGAHADYYVRNGLGHYIGKDEARELIRKNEQAGLVIQPYNTQKVGGMCSCCGCCCGMLRSLKKQPSPAEAVKSNYFAEVNRDECIGCETCVERCQMDAIRVDDGLAEVDLNRCIGCGLCVTTCPTEAIRLFRKPEQNIPRPRQAPNTSYDWPWSGKRAFCPNGSHGLEWSGSAAVKGSFDEEIFGLRSAGDFYNGPYGMRRDSGFAQKRACVPISQLAAGHASQGVPRRGGSGHDQGAGSRSAQVAATFQPANGRRPLELCGRHCLRSRDQAGIWQGPDLRRRPGRSNQRFYSHARFAGLYRVVAFWVRVI